MLIQGSHVVYLALVCSLISLMLVLIHGSRKHVDDLSIVCAEMAHAFLLSPNPESKFGVTGVRGFDNPLPKYPIT